MLLLGRLVSFRNSPFSLFNQPKLTLLTDNAVQNFSATRESSWKPLQTMPDKLPALADQNHGIILVSAPASECLSPSTIR